jgi:hypothetical protein
MQGRFSAAGKSYRLYTQTANFLYGSFIKIEIQKYPAGIGEGAIGAAAVTTGSRINIQGNRRGAAGI